MPRRYFHLRKDDEIILDRDGIDIPNDIDVRQQALEAIAELRREDPFNNWAGWRIDVVDSTGRTLMTVPMDEA